jgi:TatD DNase family protein
MPQSPPNVALVDTHAHLDAPRLKANFEEMLQRAGQAGVVQIVAVATTAEDSASVVDLAARRAGIFAAVGIHPNDAAEAQEGDWSTVGRLARSAKVVAIGETGLDSYRDRTPFPLQQEWFDRHIDLAEALNLPVIIHCRECERAIIDQLSRRQRSIRGVLHSFTGTWDDAQAFLDLGLYLSFAGMITFSNKNLDPLRDVASQVPQDRILVETDSPYLTPHPFRGKVNEPGHVRLTAERLALLRGWDLAQLAAITTANARRLFALPETELLAG